MPVVEVVVRLAAAIQNAGLSRRKDWLDKRTLSGFAVGQEYPGGNGLVQVKAKVSLGFLDRTAVSPMHGENRVDQRPIDGGSFAPVRVFLWERARGLGVKRLEYLQHLFAAAMIDSLEECALFDSMRRGNHFAGEIVLAQVLRQVSSRPMLLQVKVKQCLELLFKIHLYGFVASRL